MTGEKNVFDYITTEGKRTGKRTALEYLQKNTGVFNDKGMIPQEQVDEMKARLKENKGNIWHGFISLNAVESPKIDTNFSVVFERRKVPSRQRRPNVCVASGQTASPTYPLYLLGKRTNIQERADGQDRVPAQRPHR